MALDLTPKAAMRDVERATKARQRADKDATEAQDRQADAIRVALKVPGVTVAEIARVTGLTTQRIYQIRDGTRVQRAEKKREAGQ